MSDHDHASNYAEGEIYETDMRTMTVNSLFLWAGGLSVIFFASVFALVVYFRWERDFVLEAKIATMESAELKALRKEESAWLDGKKGKSDIQKAMAAAVKELKK